MIVGVVLAALLFMRRMAVLTTVDPVRGKTVVGADIPPGVRLYEIAGPMFFGAAKTAMEALHTIGDDDHTYILDMQHVPTMDATGLVALESVLDRLRRSKIKVIFAGLVERGQRHARPRRHQARAGPHRVRTRRRDRGVDGDHPHRAHEAVDRAGCGRRIVIRDVGHGDPPIVVLHGGWGYAFYPFDDAIAAIPRRFVIPDRTGYAGEPPGELAPGFHAAFAIETEGVLDELAIRRCVLWGHSDGAVIAAILAIRDPSRYAAIVLESIHLDRVKPRSRAFFTMMAEDPDGFGERVASRLAINPHWRDVLRAGGRAWLHIAATPADDFYDRRLGELTVPVLVLHGADDPRTEPGELDRLRREVPRARVEIVAGAGHSPHSERATAATCSRIVAEFLTSSQA